jgi:hypothetical protein
MSNLKYKAGYKYQTCEDYERQLGPAWEWRHLDGNGYVDLDDDGALGIRAGYAWDGPSGCTIDSANFITPSLVHDALYQLLRRTELEGIDRERLRRYADELLYEMCVERGMWRVRAWWVFRAVRMFGGKHAEPGAEPEVKEVP